VDSRITDYRRTAESIRPRIHKIELTVEQGLGCNVYSKGEKRHRDLGVEWSMVKRSRMRGEGSGIF